MNQQRFLDVAQAPDLPTFERLLVAFASDLDFGIFAAAVVVDRPGTEPSFHPISNTPAGFKDASRSLEASRRDPVLKRLKRLSVPFVYDQDLYVSEGAGDLWEEQASYGYRAGVSVALHLPGNKHFLLGIDRDAPLPTDEVTLIRLLAALQLIAVHAQDAALRLLVAHDDPMPRLTRREIEVLRWTKEGKSAWETGRLMGVTENTVNFHVRNITMKLDAMSKHQAVLKAIALGIL